MLINTTTKLKEICEKLEAKQPQFIAVDTEFITSSKLYYPTLCLIQIACKDIRFIVDTLASDIDLSPLKQVLLDTKIIKVFHGCKHDIEALFTVLSKVISPVFDTQIAAMFCYYYENLVGYSKLVKQIKGIELDKTKLKNSNWLKRPLSKEQIEYALNDVIHLYDLYQILHDKLVKDNKILWFLEEMEKISNTNIYAHNSKGILKRIQTNRELKVELISMIKSISEWQEILAKRYNINRNHIINSSKIVSMAEECLAHSNVIKDCIKKYTKKSVTEEDLLEFIKILDKNKKVECKLDENLLNYNKFTLDILLMLLYNKCQVNNISQKLVASKNEVIKSICRQNSSLSKGWRYEFFGKCINDFIDGNSEIIVSANKIDCKATNE